MTLPPGRFDYAPINDRPILKDWITNPGTASPKTQPGGA
jgi:hypothetical protein